MAGRGPNVTVVLFASAIALQALAFTLWDVGTRPPVTLMGDVVRAFRRRRGLVAGMTTFLAGLALTALAQILLDRAEDGIDIVVIRLGLEAWTICAALLVEMLAGPPLRALGRTLWRVRT